jgi:hypothetical protein
MRPAVIIHPATATYRYSHGRTFLAPAHPFGDSRERLVCRFGIDLPDGHDIEVLEDRGDGLEELLLIGKYLVLGRNLLLLAQDGYPIDHEGDGIDAKGGE